MEKKIFLPRGTADILPGEVHLWQAIEAKAHRIFRSYNYREVRTPLFEQTGLYRRSLGQTSDVVSKQLLELASDKQEGFSLRPEGTASVVRAYVEHNLDKKEHSAKFYYIGPMFRGERPQKGRLRQFHQIGVEVLGPGASHPYLDAEVIALNVALLKAFGLEGFTLKINTLGSARDKEAFSEVLRGLLGPKSKKLCDDCRGRVERNIFRVLDCKNKICRETVAGLKITGTHLSPESRTYFARVKEALDILALSYDVCFNLVRGLDYYTHTVFEITSGKLGSQDAVSAGGRYNNLVSQLGGPQTDAVGFALGIERVILAGTGSNDVALKPVDVYVIALDESALKKAFQLLDALRREGICGDMSYRIASMKSQMRLADKMGTRNVIILGEAELAKEVISLKDMVTGDQEELAVHSGDYTELIKKLQKGNC